MNRRNSYEEKWKISGRRFLAFLLATVLFMTAQGIPAQAEGPVNPKHNCTKSPGGTDTTDWSYVYFGSYPQTEVTGSDLTAAITGASYNANGDAWVNGTKYHRISKDDTNNTNNFGSSTYRYFKWERIRWRVLKNDGTTLFVMADRGLDCKRYRGVIATTATTWESSTLRTWLNDSFYQTAFSSKEQQAVVKKTVKNAVNRFIAGSPGAGGKDTEDWLYLLTYEDVHNEEYGFCEGDQISVSRQVQVNDYTRAMSAFASKGDGTQNMNCRWWLCTPTSCWFMSDDGTSGEGGTTTCRMNRAIRKSLPAASQ